jgi:intracellular multiplication protein IcmB
MGVIEKCVGVVEDAMEFVGRYMIGRDLASYCELATAIGLSDEDLRRDPEVTAPHILVTSTNALVSVFDVQGTFRLMGDEDFEQVIDNLRLTLGSYMRTYGHSLSMVFERDPDRARDELMRLAEPQINSARRMGLAIEDIILDRVERNTPLVAWEQNLLVVYTHMTVMSPEERKRELAQRAEEAKTHKLPSLKYAQSPASVLAAMKYRHDTFVERIRDDFMKSGPAGEGGVLLSPMSAAEAAKRVRIMLNRERTSQKWKPVLPGDRVQAAGAPSPNDYSDVALPRLNYQICTNDVHPDGEFIQTDSLYHGVLSMELGPQEPQLFQSLLAQINHALPWRIRMDLEPGGLDKTRGRRTALAFVGMFPGNSLIKESFESLTEEDKEDPVCTMRVTASTWAPDKVLLKQRLSALEKALQSWGVCQVRSTHGDPMRAMASSIVAMNTSSVANMLFPPLREALAMMPFQRPATPWAQSGSLLVRTPEGKIYPIQLGSRLQDVDIRLISAPPGSGKSVWLTTMNLSAVLTAGAKRLPLITIIDVGPSSSGFIQTLQDGLPEERRNEALYLRLVNDPKYTCNFLDVQLGARAPTKGEFDFMVDFVVGLLSDAQEMKAPSGDCARLASRLLRVAFSKKASKEPNVYEPQVEPLVDAAIERLGLREAKGSDWWDHALWYEVADLLFEHSCTRESLLAHRKGVPILSDLAAALNEPEVKQQYGGAMTSRGEALLEYAQRCFTSAAEDYALFAGSTRFELGSETRVIALDLQAVIGSQTPEGRLRTALMLMFARNLAAKNYFLDEEDLLEQLPSSGIYHEYHRQRVADIRDEKKTIAYDEFHNTGGLEVIVSRIIKDGREGRKWGIGIALASQYLEDYPEPLLNAATSVYVMRGGNSADDKRLRANWNISEDCIRRLNREATGPGPQGGNFLAIFKTKVGTIVQILTNTPGPIELWASSTTPEDMALRKRMYLAIGPYAARKVLAARFRAGSAASFIEKLRNDSRGDDDVSVIDRLASELVAEYRSGKYSASTSEAL